MDVGMIVGYSRVPPRFNSRGIEVKPAAWEALVLVSVGETILVNWAIIDRAFNLVDDVMTT